MNMGLSNFGVRMGGYLGMALLALLGGVAPPAFVNMQWLILIRALCRLVPVLFIPLLIPKGSPRDDAFKIRGRDDGVKLHVAHLRQPRRRRVAIVHRLHGRGRLGPAGRPRVEVGGLGLVGC